MHQPLRAPSTRTILIVDDDEAIREVLGDVLEDEGYAVVSAVNGAVALSLLEEMTELPGLVLLDLMMPVMSGWEFLDVVRADERFAKIPIIVVSATNAKAPGKAPGVREHLAKPIDLERLLAAIAESCD